MKAAVTLLLIAAGLAGTITLELRDSGLADPPAAAPASIPPASRSSADATPAADAVLRSRPPFSPDRRPVVAAAAVVAAEAVEGLPRLTGIMIGPFGRSAMFTVPGRAKPVVVRPGERVGTLTVEQIDTDHVTATSPGGPLTLRPIPATLAPAGDPGTPPASKPTPPPFLLDLAPRGPVAPPRPP